MTSICLFLALIVGCSAVHVTVYQSPLTYYDESWDNKDHEWVELSESATIMEFSSRAECQFLTLPFPLPFYADKLYTVGVTLLGFLYTGPYSNARLTELMHIAPFMNLYNTTLGQVKHETRNTDEGVSMFIVQWSNLSLRNEFTTFQTQLFSNGSIVFAYKNVSTWINSGDHPSIISVVNAYPIKSSSKDLTYFEYQEITGDSSQAVNGSVLALTPRINCQAATNCTYCEEVGASTDFTCKWCTELQRCSDGFESRYEDWTTSCMGASADCDVLEEVNTTLQNYNDKIWEEHLEEVKALLETMLEVTGASYTDHSCSSGQFYNPYTQSCSDCLYCVVEECAEECQSNIQSKHRSDATSNMKVKTYKFPGNSGGNPWKSAFIGIVCGLCTCMSIAAIMMCMKRRQYQQPGSWSLNMPGDGLPGLDDQRPLATSYGSEQASLMSDSLAKRDRI